MGFEKFSGKNDRKHVLDVNPNKLNTKLKVIDKKRKRNVSESSTCVSSPVDKTVEDEEEKETVEEEKVEDETIEDLLRSLGFGPLFDEVKKMVEKHLHEIFSQLDEINQEEYPECKKLAD